MGTCSLEIPKTEYDGVLCIFDKARDLPQCHGEVQKTPPSISYRERLAWRLIFRAEDKQPPKAKMLLIKAANILGDAARIAQRIAAKMGQREMSRSHRTRKITSGCAQALSTTLREARDAALRQCELVTQETCDARVGDPP